MARTAFSVRFPATLADALDDWAAARQSSRSDLVEAIITATTAADCEEILQAQVSGAPTEKLNLRLSPAALAHLAQLAGALSPADFLRRTVAAAVGAEGRTVTGPQNPAAASSPRAGRRSGARAAECAASGTNVHAPLIGLVVLVLIAALGIVIWILVQAIARASEPSPPPPGPDSRGQLDAGTPDGGGA
jgi:hypothetical protein